MDQECVIMKNVLTTLWDENGEEIEAAPHAMMICKMKVTEPVKPLDMIRKKKVKYIKNN